MSRDPWWTYTSISDYNDCNIDNAKRANGPQTNSHIEIVGWTVPKGAKGLLPNRSNNLGCVMHVRW